MYNTGTSLQNERTQSPLAFVLIGKEETMKRLFLALSIAVLTLTAACGGDAVSTTTVAPATTAGPAATTATTAATETTAGSVSEAAVQVATSDLGEILNDPEGRTLYLFLPDGQGDPTCYDDCAATWRAFTETVTAGAGLDASLLATAPRTDGTEQVTYNGWPLYYFAGDEAPGDTNGQGIGDIWWVLGPAGEAISG
ncbi:lipoprotein [soil metagenome]